MVRPSKGRNECMVCKEHCGRTVADPAYVIVVREGTSSWRRMIHPDEDDRTDLLWGYAHLACWERGVSKAEGTE